MAAREPDGWDWDPPFPYGYPAAIDSAGLVAAPFLAGFSLTLLGLLIPESATFRLGDLALILLAAAAVCFIATVQCTFWARQYVVSPEEIRMWRPGYEPARQIALQRLHMAAFNTWSARSVWTYRAGILLVMAGVAVALVPKGSIGLGRAAAIAVLGIGFLGEVLWILAGLFLAGSPNFVYDDRPDAPPASAGRLRRWPTARRVARFFVPLTRLERPPDVAPAGEEEGRQE